MLLEVWRRSPAKLSSGFPANIRSTRSLHDLDAHAVNDKFALFDGQCLTEGWESGIAKMNLQHCSTN